jgi:P4 family phage/plasmid primase-like protien
MTNPTHPQKTPGEQPEVNKLKLSTSTIQETTNPIKLLDAALEWCERGYAVIPIIPTTKKPYVKWLPYEERKPTQDEVTRWWTQWPDAWIAIVGGHDGLACFDVDQPELATKLIDQFKDKARLEQSPRGGLHIWLRESAEEPSKSGVLVPGIADLKGAKAYFLVAPSKGYKWINSIPEPLDIPGTARDLSETILRNHGYEPQEVRAAAEPLPKGKISEGGRNATLTSIGGTLRRRGCDEATILITLKAINTEKCDPPLPDDEVAAIAKSVSRYEPETPPDNQAETETSIEEVTLFDRISEKYHLSAVELATLVKITNAIINYCGGVMGRGKPDVLSKFLEGPQHPIQRGFQQLFTKQVIKKSGPTLAANPEGKKAVQKILADHLIRKYEIKTIYSIVARAEEIHLYMNGYFQLDGGLVRQEIEALLDLEFNTNLFNEVTTRIKARTVVKREAFEPDPRYINLKNGVYDLETDKLLPHSPDFMFLQSVPIEYDPAADCPLFKQVVKETLKEEHIRVFEEIFSYSLYRRYSIKKAAIFVGPGDTGKTTLLSTLTKFIGEDNTSGQSMQSLANNRFMPVELYGKLLNAFDELPPGNLKNVDMLKLLTGQGRSPGERKFCQPFNFWNYAKLVFTCNYIPAPVKDAHDMAFFGRWIVLPFDNVRPEDDRDPDLAYKLTKPTEMSGILNLALTRLKELLDRRHFSYNLSQEEVKEVMMRSGSPIAAFAYDTLIQTENPDNYITRADMFDAFARYARERKLSIGTLDAFSKSFPDICPWAYGSTVNTFETQPSGKAKRKQVKCWRNVRLNEEFLPKDQPEYANFPMYGKPHDCSYGGKPERCLLCGEFPLFSEKNVVNH